MIVHENQTPLRSKDQTGRAMYRLVESYSGDLQDVTAKHNGRLVPLCALPLRRYFSLVKHIPYRQDNEPIEVVARPKHIIGMAGLGMDCKKKGILIAAWLKQNQIPYRFIASSRRPDRRIHHVFPQGRIGRTWVNLDATYSHYKPFGRKQVTAAEVLKPGKR